MTKKRKIGFIINSLSSGGAERVVTTLANNLIKTYEVSIVTFISIPPFYDLDKSIEIIHCFETIKPSSNSFQALKSNFKLLKKMNTVVKERNIELIISFMTTANVLGVIIARLNNIPVIISERTNPYFQKIPKLWNVLRIITYRYADTLVVQTETIKSFFRNKVHESKIRILPNPISNELTNNRILNNLAYRENVILSVGRLTPLKAHAILIKAFALTDYENWELWIAGDGPEYKNLERLIIKLNLNKHIKLFGQVKDIHNLYNSAKIFAFSSTYEGFPNALIEAMHFGLGCVSTDCPTGPAEVIKDGENGYLIPINNSCQMSKKLNTLMIDESKLDVFSRKGIASVQQYEEKKVVAQWKNIINNLIDYNSGLR